MKIFNWNNLSEPEKKAALLRPALSDNNNIKNKVQDIIDQVKSAGDETLINLTEKYDRVKLNNLQVSASEFNNAANKIGETAIQAIQFAKQQIETNHKAHIPKTQIVETSKGVLCERQSRPIGRVGLYIPGGSAPLVSTVLMLGVPAQIANCPTRILCTPPNLNGEIDPHILFAAQLCGIERVYKVGGAQAIAAMAYGTETIPKVDKIFGPGNAWVTQAKMLVAQDANGAAIDMPAGPSEVMVIADDNANHEFVAADLLSQAEHGEDSQVMLIALSNEFALNVIDAVNNQATKLPRYNIIQKSLAHSRAIIVNNINEALTISNDYAPEHLILQIENPEKYISLIQNAGAVFLGPYAPETVGDYVTGSNHVLPTYGYAKNFSGLSVQDFMKSITFQTVTQIGLEKIGPYAEKLAEIEGLDAHKQAVSLRLAQMEITHE